MMDSLRHRGPDGDGKHIKGSVGLGHTRLSIIDLESGAQPLYNEDRSVVAVCNGEIYNFHELRESLQKKGHLFSTGSDCEVLVHLWEEYKTDCVSQLRGMFSFVIHDTGQDVVFGARDRFGQKPLFYHQGSQGLAFASEMKALLTLPWISGRISPEKLDQFLFYQYVPVPGTMMEGVSQLPPGHTLLFRDGELSIEKYWSPPFHQPPDLTDEEHLERLRHALDDAVHSHMLSDVPVGIFLSGGLDSSLVTSIARRKNRADLMSFSISFPGEKYDESRYARMASERFSTKHHEFAFQPDHLPRLIESVVATFDQPLADPAALPLWYLSKHASQQVKVVLTGDGGDELMAGYSKYQRAASTPGPLKNHALRSWLRKKVGSFAGCKPDPAKLRKAATRLALLAAPELESIYYKHYWEGWRRHALYSKNLRNQLRDNFSVATNCPAEEFGKMSPLDTMLCLDQRGYLPGDLLLKTDYATMAHGIEARAPLLDHLLAEAAAKLPHHLKATGSETKVGIRRLSAGILPGELVSRPKRGFGVPLEKWFREDLKDWVKNVLLDSSATVPEYFNPSAVSQVIEEHVAGTSNHSRRLYSLLTIELWYRRYCQ